MKPFNPDEHFARLIVRIRVLLSQKLGQALKEQDQAITSEQWALLVVLWEEDGISQKELAARAFKDAPTTTRILKILETKNIVVRKVNERDRRMQQVFLTSFGKELFPKLIPSAVAVIEKAQQGLSEEEVRELNRMLKIIRSNLE